jgi:tetratricopeptide (TPR) repeat protein
MVMACLASALLDPLAAAAQPVPGSAEAEAAPDSPGRVHRRRGREHYDAAHYDAAIAEFRKAYELEADPSVLFDIAEAYRHLGVPERARFFYRRYLSALPTAANRVEVEARIAALDQELSALPPSAARPEEASPPAPSPLGVAAAAPAPSPEVRRPLTGRWWFWAAVGAVVTGATITLVAVTRRQDPEVPPSMLGNKKLFE